MNSWHIKRDDELNIIGLFVVKQDFTDEELPDDDPEVQAFFANEELKEELRNARVSSVELLDELESVMPGITDRIISKRPTTITRGKV